MSMDNDDLPVGRVLGRREVVRLLALTGAAAMVGCRSEGGGAHQAAAADSSAGTLASTSASGALPSCVVRPELTVGPYFVDKQANRSDIRSDPRSGKVSAGTPLALTFNVSRVDGGRCAPLAGAMVDVWHYDASGQYSGVNDQMIGFDTVGQKFLRGYQVTDANGQASFTTIYPGWYQGRTVHVHFKIRTPAAAALADAANVYEFTSQLFFDDALTDRVFAQAPYAAKGQREMRNADDGIYQEAGPQLVLAMAPAGTGYDARFDVGLDLSNAAVGKADRGGGPEGPGGRGGPGGPGGPPPGGRPPRRPRAG
jgi:protocatechuate 3,4-dioxygenase beta subunit